MKIMISIDIANFTPFSAFLGGMLIGIAIIVFFISNGRLAGISGIVNNTLTKSRNRSVNLLFLFGLILGPIIFMIFTQSKIPFTITTTIPIIISSGLLVGIGTKICNGCTSGHGICGISLFSIRSIIATLVFILAAILTVFVLKLIGLS